MKRELVGESNTLRVRRHQPYRANDISPGSDPWVRGRGSESRRDGTYMSEEKQTFHLLQPRAYPSKLSLVIPMYNEEAVVPLLRPALEQFMGEVSCRTEVILVNDGSYDGTLEKISSW